MGAMYKKSDYAMNRKSNGIIYRPQKGQTIRITVDVYVECMEQNGQNNPVDETLTRQNAGGEPSSFSEQCKRVEKQLRELRQKLKSKVEKGIPLTFTELKGISDLEYKRQWQKDDIEYKRSKPSGTPQDYAERRKEGRSRNTKNKNQQHAGNGYSHHPSAEQEYFDGRKEHEEMTKHRKRMCTAGKALAVLTSKQRRRYILYNFHGKTIREISDIEGVPNHNAVSESIKQAQGKIRDFLKMVGGKDRQKNNY